MFFDAPFLLTLPQFREKYSKTIIARRESNTKRVDNARVERYREAVSEISKEQYLYLTTIGRKTGLAREIEIWFVEADGKFYLLSGDRGKSQWVKNIQANPRVRVRVGTREFAATARVLDAERDRAAYRFAQKLEKEKYGWGAGLPVEIVPDGAL